MLHSRLSGEAEQASGMELQPIASCASCSSTTASSRPSFGAEIYLWHTYSNAQSFRVYRQPSHGPPSYLRAVSKKLDEGFSVVCFSFSLAFLWPLVARQRAKRTGRRMGCGLRRGRKVRCAVRAR